MDLQIRSSERYGEKAVEKKYRAAGPLLVATDGTSGSDAALRLARLLVGRTGADVHVLSVVTPLTDSFGEYGAVNLTAEVDAARQRDMRSRVEQQLRTVLGEECGWAVEVRLGDAARVIAREASELRAQAIIVGLGDHGFLDRLGGTETVLSLIRLASIPVLAIPSGFDEIPRRALVAVDFSPASIEAARAALELLQDFTMLYLVHVAPRPALLDTMRVAWESEYDTGTAAAMQQVRTELAIPPAIAVEEVMVRGDPSTEILRFTDASGVNLIVCANHGRGFLHRLVLGSVTTRVLRGAKCAVLVVPGRGQYARSELGMADKSLTRSKGLGDRADWAAFLQEFTRSNAGRRVTLEIDDPDLGAQAQAVDYPLLGVASDRRDGRIEIMLGQSGDLSRHLTHTIGGVTSLDVLKGQDGRDEVLRIVQSHGQTLLTFLR